MLRLERKFGRGSKDIVALGKLERPALDALSGGFGISLSLEPPSQKTGKEKTRARGVRGEELGS